MTRWLALVAIAYATIACTPSPDVVAYGPNEGEPPALPTPTPVPMPTDVPPAPSPGFVQCTKIGSPIVVRTKDGRLALLADRASAAQFLPSPPDCLVASQEPVALTSDGTVWALSGGKAVVVDPSGACKPLGLALTATAMSFLVDAKLGREQLYAIVDGILVVIDPASLLRTPIGKITIPEVTGLTGTIDGRLFALSGKVKPVIYELHVGDASLGAAYPVNLQAPADDTIVGIALTPSAPALVAEAAIHWLDPKLSLPSERVSYGLVGMVAAGGSPCSSLPF